MPKNKIVLTDYHCPLCGSFLKEDEEIKPLSRCVSCQRLFNFETHEQEMASLKWSTGVDEVKP